MLPGGVGIQLMSRENSDGRAHGSAGREGRGILCPRGSRCGLSFPWAHSRAQFCLWHQGCPGRRCSDRAPPVRDRPSPVGFVLAVFPPSPSWWTVTPWRYRHWPEDSRGAEDSCSRGIFSVLVGSVPRAPGNPVQPEHRTDRVFRGHLAVLCVSSWAQPSLMSLLS